MSLTATYRFMRELGLDPRRLRLLTELPRYLYDLRAWRRAGGQITSIYPVLGDRADQAGSAMNAYFHQDLLVARRIYEAQPRRHIDVGSRIDGFVAHVAVFRAIEVLDVRPLTSVISNVTFTQADLMADSAALAGITDSLSCLHALEHFGLGRYGDTVDPQGHLHGFQALINMLTPDGVLYLSFPIGRPVVEFNAHRVFHPTEVLSWPGSGRLHLQRFDYIDDAGTLHVDLPIADIAIQCEALVSGCGIYTFALRGNALDGAT
jgi:hypothetical protein